MLSYIEFPSNKARDKIPVQMTYWGSALRKPGEGKAGEAGKKLSKTVASAGD